MSLFVQKRRSKITNFLALVLPYHAFPLNVALPIFERFPKLVNDPYFIKYVIRHVVESDTTSSEGNNEISMDINILLYV